MSRFYDGDELEDRLIEAAGRGLFTPESELALVSAMLCQPSSCEDVVDRIVPELFANSILGRVWGEARSAMLSGRHVSAALIADAIGTDPAFEEWGGANKLLDLTETGSTAGVAEHAEAVADRAGRRAIKALLDRVTPALMDTSSGNNGCAPRRCDPTATCRRPTTPWRPPTRRWRRLPKPCAPISAAT